MTKLGIAGQEELTTWESTSTFGLNRQKTKVQKGEALFPRLDIEKEVEELEELFSEKNRRSKRRNSIRAQRIYNNR